MNEQQKKGLTADIKGMLNGYIDSLFLDFQQAMEIEHGDVEPFDQLYLDEKVTQVAQMITEILVKQKGE